jgi:hypothetical protein
MSSDDGPPRVFVSYAHENAEHIAQVLRFCRLLRGNGIDAWLDRYDSNERRDWYAWYLNQVTGADYVLIVASPGYHAAGDGNGPATSRRGVQTEAAHLRDLLHADRPTWIRRLLPVVLPGRSVHEIPLFLQPSCADHYVITELTTAGITGLLRTLTRQPVHPPPDLGPVSLLPPEVIPDDAAPTATTTPVGDITMTATALGGGRVYQAGRDQHITGDDR